MSKLPAMFINMLFILELVDSMFVFSCSLLLPIYRGQRFIDTTKYGLLKAYAFIGISTSLFRIIFEANKFYHLEIIEYDR